MKNLELEFLIEREKRYLERNPKQAIQLALNYLEDFLNLSKEMKNLEQRYQIAVAENRKLTSRLMGMSPPKTATLPSFLLGAFRTVFRGQSVKGGVS